MKKIIITEALFKKIFLTESIRDESIKAARKLYLKYNPTKTNDEAIEWLKNIMINYDIVDKKEKYTMGVARLVLNNEIDDVPMMQMILNIIANNDKLLVKYGKNLDDKEDGNKQLSFADLTKLFSKMIQDFKIESEELAKSVKITGKTEYSIEKIDSFEQAGKYSNYCNWCLTNSEYFYDAYVDSGDRQLYICTKPGFEDLEFDDQGYQYSMIGVLVDNDNTVFSWVDRFNENEHRINKCPENKKELIEILNVNFDDVFKAKNNYDEYLKTLLTNMENVKKVSDVLSYGRYKGEYVLLKNGELMLDDSGKVVLFDFITVIYRKYLSVLINSLGETLVDFDGNFIWDGKWYFGLSETSCGDVLKVEDDDSKENLVDLKGNLLCDIWSPKIEEVVEGKFQLSDDYGRQFFINSKGEYLVDRPLLSVDNSENGGYVIQSINDEYNILTYDLELKYSQWFNYIEEIEDGNYLIEINGKGMNIVDDSGNYLIDLSPWPDDIRVFDDEALLIHMEGYGCNIVTAMGKLYFAGLWFKDIEYTNDFNYDLTLFNGDTYCVDDYGNVLSGTTNIKNIMELAQCQSVHEGVHLHKLIKSITRKVIQEQLFK